MELALHLAPFSIIQAVESRTPSAFMLDCGDACRPLFPFMAPADPHPMAVRGRST